MPLRWLLAWVHILTIGVTAWTDESKPNVIFIMADDLGYTDLGCYGSKYYETPHIDRLASQGLRMLCHHHCQNCAPTRAAIMSGQYGARTGIYTVGGINRFDWRDRPLRPVDNVENLPLGLKILPQVFKDSGYQTAMFGKWHLGQGGRYHPGERGFDEAIVSAGVHFRFVTHPRVDYPEGTYLADFLTDRSIDFIKRNADKPFFLYLPHFGVHGQAKKEWIDRFKDKPAVAGHHSAVYAAMIASVDESVGRILQTLDELKLAEKTLVIFTSDNGGVGGYVREGIKRETEITDNAPLRSGKGSLYEGGTRVPFIVRWPGVTKAGTECQAPTIHVDFYPTMLEVLGSPKPSQTLDGETLVPLWRDPRASLERDAIYQHFPGYLGAGKSQWRTTPVSLIQSGQWKLMEFLEDGRIELYNLASDMGESRNLAMELPHKAKELNDKLIAWRKEIAAPMPTRNDPATQPNQPLKKRKGTQSSG
jgi:arylsulfatase A-like enzyme